MTGGPPSNRLLIEIAPRLTSGGPPLVVGQVHRLLAKAGEARWSKRHSNALLLVALSYQLARRLLEDLALAPRPLVHRRLRWILRERSERVRASGLIWSGIGSLRAQPLPVTHAFMAELPEALVPAGARVGAAGSGAGGPTRQLRRRRQSSDCASRAATDAGSEGPGLAHALCNASAPRTPRDLPGHCSCACAGLRAAPAAHRRARARRNAGAPAERL